MTGSTELPSTAKIVHLEDVEKVVGGRVRVIGRLCAQDIHQQTVTLTSLVKGVASITVGVRLIYPFEASPGSLYEVIGDFVSSGGQPLLQAHTWRCMDGLDWTVYYKAVKMRREYLRHREEVSSASSGVG